MRKGNNEIVVKSETEKRGAAGIQAAQVCHKFGDYEETRKQARETKFSFLVRQ